MCELHGMGREWLQGLGWADGCFWDLVFPGQVRRLQQRGWKEGKSVTSRIMSQLTGRSPASSWGFYGLCRVVPTLAPSHLAPASK